MQKINCRECKHWDKTEDDCIADSTQEVSTLCLLRRILWHLESMNCLLEEFIEKDQGNSDDEWWKNNH
jgi:hypothetical protein